MRPEDLARIVCGDFEKLNTADEMDGYAGVVLTKNFIDNRNIDIDRFLVLFLLFIIFIIKISIH